MAIKMTLHVLHNRSRSVTAVIESGRDQPRLVWFWLMDSATASCLEYNITSALRARRTLSAVPKFPVPMTPVRLFKKVVKYRGCYKQCVRSCLYRYMVRVVCLWPMTGESNILLLFLFVTQFLLALLLLDGVVESFSKLGRFLWFLFIGFQFPVDLVI